MHVLRKKESFTIGNKKPLSSFELITNWLDIGNTLELSSNALQVMTHLLRFYNPEKKYVFPHQETLAERTNTSIASVKRALAELIKAQLLIKTRTKRGNVYGFTSKLFELLDSSRCTLPTAQNEPCMNEQINRKNKKTSSRRKTNTTNVHFNNDDDFNSYSNKTKHVTLNDVPFHVRENKKILNPCAYWASLNEQEKLQQLEKAREIEKKKLISLEKMKKLKEEKARKIEEEKKRKEELSKPLEEQFTRNQAIKMVWQLRKIHKGKIKPGLVKSLVELYNLDIVSICSMSEGEIERYMQ